MGRKGKNKGNQAKLEEEQAKKDGAGSSSVVNPTSGVSPKTGGKNKPKVAPQKSDEQQIETKDAEIGSKPKDKSADPSPDEKSSSGVNVAPQKGDVHQPQIETKDAEIDSKPKDKSADPSPDKKSSSGVSPKKGGKNKSKVAPQKGDVHQPQIETKDAEIGSKPKDKSVDPSPDEKSSSNANVAPQKGDEEQQQIAIKDAEIGGDPSPDERSSSSGKAAPQTESEEQQQVDKVIDEATDSSPEDSGVDKTPQASPSHCANVGSQTGDKEPQQVDTSDEGTDSCPEDSGVDPHAPRSTNIGEQDGSETSDAEIDLFTVINKKRDLRSRFQRWRRRFEGAIRIAVVKESIRIKCINDINNKLSDNDYAPLVGAFENLQVIVKNSAFHRMLLTTKLTYLDLLITHVELMLRDEKYKNNLIKDDSFQKLRDLLEEQVTFLQKHLKTINEEFRNRFSQHNPHLQEIIKNSLQKHSTLKEMLKGVLDLTNRMYCLWPKLFLSCINCVIIFIDSVDLFLSS